MKKKKLVKKLTHENHKQTQIMVDKVFSFAELGFHEVESSKYLTSILEKANFKIEYEISDIPTAWFAKWSNGSGPVIATWKVMLMEFRKLHNTLELHTIDQWLKEHLGHGEGNTNSGLPVVYNCLHWQFKKIMMENKHKRNLNYLAWNC